MRKYRVTFDVVLSDYDEDNNEIEIPEHEALKVMSSIVTDIDDEMPDCDWGEYEVGTLNVHYEKLSQRICRSAHETWEQCSDCILPDGIDSRGWKDAKGAVPRPEGAPRAENVIREGR